MASDLNFWTQLLSPVSKHHTIRICFTGLYHTSFFFFQKVCQRWSQVNQQSTKRLACSVLRLVYQWTIQILSNERCKSQRYDCSYNVTDLNKRVMLKFEISKKCFSLIIVFSVTIHVYIYIYFSRTMLQFSCTCYTKCGVVDQPSRHSMMSWIGSCDWQLNNALSSWSWYYFNNQIPIS